MKRSGLELGAVKTVRSPRKPSRFKIAGERIYGRGCILALLFLLSFVQKVAQIRAN